MRSECCLFSVYFFTSSIIHVYKSLHSHYRCMTFVTMANDVEEAELEMCWNWYRIPKKRYARVVHLIMMCSFSLKRLKSEEVAVRGYFFRLLIVVWLLLLLEGRAWKDVKTLRKMVRLLGPEIFIVLFVSPFARFTLTLLVDLISLEGFKMTDFLPTFLTRRYWIALNSLPNRALEFKQVIPSGNQ